MKNRNCFNALRIVFCLSLLFLFLSILSGGLYAIICWIIHYICIAISVSIYVASIILYIVQVKENDNVVWSTILFVLIFIMMVTTIFFTRTPFILWHNYTEVQRGLKKNHSFAKTKYKIIGINKNANFGGDIECEYIFDVIAYDGNNRVFQAGYCEHGVMWRQYDVVDNY